RRTSTPFPWMIPPATPPVWLPPVIFRFRMKVLPAEASRTVPEPPPSSVGVGYFAVGFPTSFRLVRSNATAKLPMHAPVILQPSPPEAASIATWRSVYLVNVLGF